MTIFKLEMNDAGAIMWFEGNMRICNDLTFELHGHATAFSGEKIVIFSDQVTELVMIFKSNCVAND